MKNQNFLKGTIITIVFLMLSMVAFVGCSNETKNEPAAQEATQKNQEPATTDVEAIAEQPVLITSFGQSADVAMLKAVMNKTEIPFEYNTLAKPEDLANIKTLIIAAGASSKGLGAAGIKPEEEIERAKVVMEKAKADNITIIAAHIGGESRRGDLSDQFVNLAINDASHIIVVESGNADGLFTNVAKEKNIPISVVEGISKCGEPLKKLFK